jgi:plasmid stabilization system protein ParE
VTQLDFRPAAAADVEAAFRWYQVQREGLGDEFLNELVLVVHAIGENAYRFPVVHRDTRRALLHRFPYALFYRILPDRIMAVGCFHAARDPRRSRARR